MTDEEYIEAARERYQREDAVKIEDAALVSRGDPDDQAWVRAWVWVPEGLAPTSIDEWYIERARNLYQSDEITIADDATVFAPETPRLLC